MEERECARCGATFMPAWRGRRTYCTRECADAAHLNAARARVVYVVHAPRRCAACGEMFTPKPKAARQKYCKAKCKQRTNNARQRRSWLPLTNPSAEPKACASCGSEFVPKRRTRMYCYDSYCAQSAYKKRKRAGEGLRQREHVVTCDGCGKKFVAKHPLARWCPGGKCASRHWGLVKSRQRGQLSDATYTDLQIFERDRWRCHLCGKKVRRDVDRMHPEGATIDHLVPTALGGKDEPGNVATAHRRCNRAKGTRAVGEQLALL